MTSDYVLSLGGFDALGVPPSERALYVVAAPGADKVAVQRSADRGARGPADGDRAEPDPGSPLPSTPRSTGCSRSSTRFSGSPSSSRSSASSTRSRSVWSNAPAAGLLQAVGMARTQVRTMVRLESVTIAVLGAVLGVVLGLAFGIAIRSSLREDGLESWPSRAGEPPSSSWWRRPWGWPRPSSPAAGRPRSTSFGRSPRSSRPRHPARPHRRPDQENSRTAAASMLRVLHPRGGQHSAHVIEGLADLALRGLATGQRRPGTGRTRCHSRRPGEP